MHLHRRRAASLLLALSMACLCGDAFARASTDLLSPGRLQAQARFGSGYDGGSTRRRSTDQGSGGYKASDALLGLGVILVPGGPFLLWTDPDLQGQPLVGPIQGVVLFMAAAAFGLKSYVDGDVGQGVGIHLGSMALGFGGFYYSQPEHQPGRRAESPGRTDGPALAWSARF